MKKLFQFARSYSKSFVALAFLLMAALGVRADGTTVADPTAVLTTASTTVTTVTAIVAGVVGFFIIVAIVKWVRTK